MGTLWGHFHHMGTLWGYYGVIMGTFLLCGDIVVYVNTICVETFLLCDTIPRWAAAHF